MTQATRVHSTPPLNSSLTQGANPPQERRAESVDSFSLQPAIGQPESANRTSDSPSPFEAMDGALLRFVNCLVGYGLTLDEAGAIVSAEIERLRAGKPRPRPVVRSASGGPVARLQRRLDNWQRLRHPAAV
jgi:hypothetical protein